MSVEAVNLEIAQGTNINEYGTIISSISPAGYTGTFTGNASGLTNFTGLVWTNSAAGYLTLANTKTVASLGIVTANVIITNAQDVWFTNQISHICYRLGSTGTLTGTNSEFASMMVNASDVVLVTNMTGSGNASLLGSWFQMLR
jgi:hypothetical protein